MAAEEGDDPVVERVVAVAGDHMAGAGNLEIVGLRRRVEALLRAHDAPGDFLKPAALETTVARPADPTAGALIGPYKLLQRIGEGGFGTVWLAEQREPVRRRVALKVIKLGMDTKQVIARFEAERQALAMMEHPNIARVLDAGATDAGRPYFVMELVAGVPITEFCDANTLTRANAPAEAACAARNASTSELYISAAPAWRPGRTCQ